MNSETYDLTKSTRNTQLKRTTPKHKKKSKKPFAAAAALVLLLIGVGAASFFLHPSISVFNVQKGRVASVSIASYFSGGSMEQGLANRAIREEQEAEEAARIAEEEAAAAQEDEDAYSSNYGYEYGYGSDAYNCYAPGLGTWHPAWVEKIVHPAQTEYMSSYPVYVCIYDGYETTDFGEILEYVHHDDNAFVVLTRGGYEVPRSEEWVETIYHPGYWE